MRLGVAEQRCSPTREWLGDPFDKCFCDPFDRCFGYPFDRCFGDPCLEGQLRACEPNADCLYV